MLMSVELMGFIAWFIIFFGSSLSEVLLCQVSLLWDLCDRFWVEGGPPSVSGLENNDLE